MRISKRFIGASAAVLAIAAIAYAAYLKSAAKPVSPATATAVAGPDGFDTPVPISVDGAEVVKDTLVLYVTAAGQSEARRLVSLAPEASGRVAEIHVGENELVRAGQVLLSLDTTEFVYALEEARMALRDAEARHRDLLLTDDLFSMTAAVRASRDSAARIKSGVDAASLRLRQAQMVYSRSKLVAPFDGRIADLKIARGARVGASSEVMKIMETDPIRISVHVLEANISTVVVGRTTHVRLSAFPNETFTGVVESINPMVEFDSRTARVNLRVPNPRGRILPGMYARALIEGQRLPNRILVPRSAILTRPRGEMLYVFDPKTQRSEQRYVTTGLGNDDLVEILSNPGTHTVAPGEIVLTGGHHTLAPNVVVSVRKR